MEFGSDPLVKSMFNASIGDGNLTLFWEDRWLGCDSPCLIAPELCKLAKAKVRKSRTVHDALTNKQWIHDIVGTLTVQAISEYLSLLSLWPSHTERYSILLVRNVDYSILFVMSELLTVRCDRALGVGS